MIKHILNKSGFKVSLIIACGFLLWMTLSHPTPVVWLQPQQFLKSNHEPLRPNEISHSATVTCLLVTSPARHLLASHMTATWIEECKHVVTLTSEETSPLLRNVQLTRYSRYEDLWGKVLEGFNSLNKSQSSWFMKVDDDTFVVMKNLQSFLSKFDSSEPLLVGLQLLYPNNENVTISSPYVSGGAGYVLSREALKRLQLSKSELCSYPGSTIFEDVNMGGCLHSLGVRQVDTRDQLGRSRFLPFPPWVMMKESLQDEDNYKWVQQESKFPVKFGTLHLTDEPISFHEVRDPNDVYLLQYFLKYFKTPVVNMETEELWTS